MPKNLSGSTSSFDKFLGKSLDALPLHDRLQLTGLWIARELYSPERLPLRIVQAIGRDTGECLAQLRVRGFDPARFEIEAVEPPF